MRFAQVRLACALALSAATAPCLAAEPARIVFALPVGAACISSPFGERVVQGPRASRFHNGIDLPAPAGAGVKAAAAGRITSIRRLGASGLEIAIAHGNGIVTRYAHLGSVAPPFASGKRTVVQGEVLGRVGRTGVTYGTHLHFEVHVNGIRVDPALFIALPRCGSAQASR
ncbi:MAG: M23 family metallopeptidase [Acetobacteraceae bacterium]